MSNCGYNNIFDGSPNHKRSTNVAKICATSPMKQGETGIALILLTRFTCMKHVLLSEYPFKFKVQDTCTV